MSSCVGDERRNKNREGEEEEGTGRRYLVCQCCDKKAAARSSYDTIIRSHTTHMQSEAGASRAGAWSHILKAAVPPVANTGDGPNWRLGSSPPEKQF